MKVKELIAQLKKYNNEDDEIIVAYWAKDHIDDWWEGGITDKQWEKLANKFDYYHYNSIEEDILYQLEDLEMIMEEDDDNKIINNS